MLGLCDVLDVAAASGPVRTYALGGRRLGLGMTPYGQAIPTDVRGLFPEADTAAWFTHHDVAFEGAYPGAVPPFPIAGCDLVVNGHIHTTKRPIRAGATLWTNPGNIARQSVDLLDHAPRAWVLDADGRLQPEALPYAADVFDLTGRVVEAAGDQAVAAAVESAFVSLLQAEASTDVRRSDDGSILAEEFSQKFAREDTPKPCAPSSAHSWRRPSSDGPVRGAGCRGPNDPGTSRREPDPRRSARPEPSPGRLGWPRRKPSASQPRRWQ